MDFLAYIRSQGLIDARQAQVISDEVGLKKTSAYSYLLSKEVIKGAGLNFTYDTLRPVLFGYGEVEGISYTEVVKTKGFVCNEAIYSAMGGVDDTLVQVILPLSSSEGGVHIAVTTTPDDEVLLSNIARAYGSTPYQIGVCRKDLWTSLFAMYVQPLLVKRKALTLSQNNRDTGLQMSQASDSEARRVCQDLINVGIERGASDVHFIPCEDRCDVHFRIDGRNHMYTDIPKDVLEKICNILKTDGHIPNHGPNEAIDGKVRYSPSGHKVPGDEIDLRISIMPSKRGSDLNVRYLSSKMRTFAELGMSEDLIEVYKHLLDLPSGMVVQVGPTGSGKSTTMYTGLEYIRGSLRNIITIEDPVEILMDGVTQIDVSSEVNARFGFADALKACLRHDPDVVVVGELRDKETANLAVRASNTGHLVLTSLHTNDAIGAFERLINMGVDSYSLGEVMVAVMGQRLVRRLCPHCKEEYELDLDSETARFYSLGKGPGTMKFYKPCGCVHCDNTGYKGRIAINEILVVDSLIRDYIQRHAVRLKFEELLHQRKFVSMYHDGLKKAIAGTTSLEEMRCYAADRIAFKG